MSVRVMARVAASVAGVVLLVPLMAAPAAAAPAMTIAPDSDLVDFQQVTVSGSGYTPGATIGIVQCIDDPGGQENCDLSTLGYTSADAGGAFSAPFEVQRLITVQGAEVDCAPDACSVGAGNISDFAEAAAAPLTFDPNVPPAPRLAIDSELDGSGSFTRAGDATVSGVVTCNMPATVFVEGFAEQRAGRSIISGSFFTTIECDGATPWTATTEFANGVFRGGRTDVQVFVFGDSGSMFDEDFGEATIRLTGNRR
jgi:hypothetical protein